MEEGPTVRVVVSMPAKMREELAEIATAQSRSTANLCAFWLADRLKQERKNGSEDDET